MFRPQLSPSQWELLGSYLQPLTMRDVLTGMIKAHEIQGCIALENSFNRVGLDHVVLVKVAFRPGPRATSE